MNLPQATDQHAKDMKDFTLAHRVYCSVWDVENKPYNNNNNNNINDHQVSSLDYHNQKHVAYVRASDHHLPPPNRITSSATSTTTTISSSWYDNNNNDDKSKNYGYSYQKTPSWINDAEVKRQKRVVKYKAYGVEGKVKASFRNGFRWVKNKYCEIVHGY